MQKSMMLYSWRLSRSIAATVIGLTVMLGAVSVRAAGAGNDLAFDGVDDYVNIADANSLDMTSNYTIETWFKADSLGSAGTLRGLVDKFQTHNSYGWLLRLDGTDLDFDLRKTTDLALQTGQWYHVAAVNSGGTRHLYVNGVEKTLSGTGYTVVANTDPVRLGSDYNARYFAGQMDEVRIWNVARSQAEIRDAMHKQLAGSESGLVAYYQCNQSSGTTLPDLTANHLDGTLVNSPAWTASTAPLPFATAQAGDWNTAATWAAGQGVPGNAWSRVLVQNAVTLGANQSVLDFSSTAAGSLALASGDVLTVTGTLNHLGVASGAGTVLLAGAASAYSLSGTFGNLELNDTAGATLGASTTVNGTFTLTSGDVNLNGQTLTLGSTATLAETGGACLGTSGTITTTRTLNAPSDSNIGGLGVGITSAANLGSTTLTRGHAAHSGSTGQNSIQRYFDISPANNISLDATLVFHYLDAELNGNTESALGLYRSADGGGTYAPAGGTVDTGANTLTLAGVAAFSRWTAASGTMNLFADIRAGLTNARDGGVAWGDYNNDGKLDILLAGQISGGHFSGIYRNDGNDTFPDIDAGLPGVMYADVAWGDYDNDGNLDFALTGVGAVPTYPTYFARIYHNNGNGTFTDINAGLPGVQKGSVAWGDYDNDGRPDLLLAGYNAQASLTLIYHNNGDGTFTDSNIALPGVQYASVAWGDYDNDGWLDFALCGSGITRIYHNNGDGTFTDINAGLPGVGDNKCSVAWGDYNNDGKLDLLLVGRTGNAFVTLIYHNNGDGTFSPIDAGLPVTSNGMAAWGDYDNDGRLDVLLTGASASGPLITSIYRNNGNGTFTEINAGLQPLARSSVAWGDYDNDGRLDLVEEGWPYTSYATRIFRNTSPAIPNTPPTAPASLLATVINNRVTLNWDAATDSETPAAGLTYNLRIGSTPGGSDIFSGMANASGLRRLPAMGNVNMNRSWTLTLNRGRTCYWSVQAVDTAFAGGPWATEGSFILPDLPPSITTSAIANMTATGAQSGGNVIAAGDSPVTARGIVWNSTGSPTLASHDGITTDGSGIGSFTSTLTGLVNNHSYYVRAYATSAAGTAYGNPRSFVHRDPATAMIPPGKALVFSGASQYVQVPHSDEFDFVVNYTLELWFKSDTVTGSQGLIGKYGNSTGWRLLRDGTELVFDGLTTSGLGLAANTCYHVAAVNSGGQRSLYVNGAQVALTGTVSGVGHNNTNPVTLGAYNGGSYFAGRLDEVRIWNRPLSSQEVRETMHLVLNGDESGLVAYYDCDETSGTTLHDRSQSAELHNGTLINMTGSEWNTSAIPAGSGVANTEAEAAGAVAFPGLNLSMNFTTAGSASLTATRINAGPPSALVLNNAALFSPWWSVDRFGSGSFSATLVFTLSQGLTAADQADPTRIGLYTRGTGSDGLLTLVATASSVDAASQTATFTGVTAFGQFAVGRKSAGTLPGVSGYRSDAVTMLFALGDYNNDGKLDVALSGTDNVTRIHRSNGDGTFTDIGVTLPGVYNGMMAWADYDNDGYLDLAIMGAQTYIYHNNGNNTFTLAATLDMSAIGSTSGGCLAWGDYNNDGRPDLLITSGVIQRKTSIYRNDGNGVFTDINAGFPAPSSRPHVAWGDYDNDSILDFVIVDDAQYVALYHNNGDGTFTSVAAGLALSGGSYCSAAWGDYDNDGYLDLAIIDGMGTAIWHNNGNGTFTDINAGLPAFAPSDSIAWGDYDNDGRLDLLISTGLNIGEGDNQIRIYLNNGGNTFRDESGNLQVGTAKTVYAAWGDFDNDGRLDVAVVQQDATYLYRNSGGTLNTPPAAPAGLSAAPSRTNVTLRWTAATDGQTPSAGLSYNLRVGTTPGAGNILSGMANLATGQRRLPALGNVNRNTNWTIRGLADGTYYWTVQAVDSAWAGGAWATEGSFFMLNDTDGDGLPDWWELKYSGSTTNMAAGGHSDTDGMDNRDEYIADTDPTNPAAFFAITAVSNLPPWTVYFSSSAGRAYTLIGVSNLASGVWLRVPGAGPRLGAGGPDALSDTNVPPKGPFYRLKVELP